MGDPPKNSSFCLDPAKNMTAMHGHFLLNETVKIFMKLYF